MMIPLWRWKQPAGQQVLHRLAATADNLDLPVWWEDGFDLDGGRSLIGWLIGGAAIAQGGPFWFDVLRRLAGFRRSALVT